MPRLPSNNLRLTEDGGNLGEILRQLQQGHRPILSEVSTAVGVAIPGVTDLRVRKVGGFFVVQLFHSSSNSNGQGIWMDLSQESDGTLRLLALLTALKQHPSPSFIGIEEPELTIHPGAMGVLSDVIQEASLRSQIMVTTHSSDLIDILPIEAIRAVEFADGETKVGRVSETQLEAVRRRLFSPGELHSMEGLRPAGV